MSCSAYATTKKPSLKYEFSKNEVGIKVQACLSNYGAEKILWLLPRFIEQNKNNKSFEIISDTTSYTIPKHDYIETSSKSNLTCVTYILEEYKGWYNQYFQDISEDSFLIFGNHSLIIPESAFTKHKSINVEFNWNNCLKPVYSDLDDMKHTKPHSLTLRDFDSLYFAAGYEVLNISQFSKDKLIYPKKYHDVIVNIVPKLKIINSYLEENHLAINKYSNSFIFAENNYKVSENPGTAYSNGKEFVQIVGINIDQIFNKLLVKTFIHEYLHKIIGHTIKFKSKKSDKEWWFKEGFVEYLSCKILLETNIWDIEDYMNFYNSRIYMYFAFGMDKYKLNDMYDKYIYDEAGYIVGMFYASKIDEFIMDQTKGKKRLLDFLNNFLNLFIKNKNLYFSENLFFKNLKFFIKTSAPSIEELHNKNNLLNPKLLSGKLSLQNKKMQIPQYSYNFYDLVTSMTVNNKKIISIIPNSVDSYVYHLKLVDENNKIMSITLRPLYKDKFIPQYKLLK